MFAYARSARLRDAGRITDAVVRSYDDRNVTAVGSAQVGRDPEVDLIHARKTRRRTRIGWRDILSAKLHGHVCGGSRA